MLEGSAAPLLVDQPAVDGDLDRVVAAITGVFSAAKAAVLDERPVVILLNDGDLLGQGGVAEAGVATGLLGLMRAFALEGAKPGWRVNVVSGRSEEDVAAVREAAEWVSASGLSGQLIRVGTAQLGKVSP